MWELFSLARRQFDTNEDTSHFGMGIGESFKYFFYKLRLATDMVQTKTEKSVDLDVINEG